MIDEVVEAAVAKPKRRKPGRPKAGRLDTAAASSIAITTNAPAEPEARTFSHFANAVVAPTGSLTSETTEAVVDEPAVTVEATPAVNEPPQPAPIAPQPPAAPRLRPVGGPRRLSDIAPRRSVASHHPDTAAKKSENQKVSSPAKSAEQPVEWSGIVGASLHERVRPVPFTWSLLPATFLALIAGGAALALLENRFEVAWAATQTAGWAVWGEIAFVLGLYYISHSLVSSALTFGASRRAAHRPVPAIRQWGVAINSFAPRLLLDTVITIKQLALVAIGTGLVMVGGSSWGVPEWLQLAALVIAFLVLLYLSAGLVLVQGLGRVAVTLAPLSLWRAVRVCWNLFRNHFELVGMRVISLILELVLLVPFAALVVSLMLYAPAELSWLTAVTVAAVALLAGALCGAGTTAWWEAAYRHLVEHDRAAAAVRLLAGRPAEKSGRWALAFVIILTTAFTSLAIAWPWLWPLI